MATPLMPKATAVWLVDNTSLTFEQIADFCNLHPLEVKGIADGEVAQGIKGLDPVANGQLTREEIERGQADPVYRLKLKEGEHGIPVRPKKQPRYTPVSKRQDRPNAIAWVVRYHPEVSDAQIARLLGTTKPTIQAIRERTHWNMTNIKPVDPVTLGLCSQLELDMVVKTAAEQKVREARKAQPEHEAETRLLSPEESLSVEQSEDEPDPDEVFAEFSDTEERPDS